MGQAVVKIEGEPFNPTSIGQLSGSEKAAILLLALGSDFGAPIWKELDDAEIISISVAMSRLGTVNADLVEELLTEFASVLSASGALMGTTVMAERLLSQYLPEDRLKSIMEEVRGPAGRTMWEKLSNVQAHVLANYLKNEYPQTVAVVLSKIAAEHAARVLSLLPEEFALDVVQRMLAMDSVQRDVLDKVEQTLRREFISNLSQTRKRDAHEQMAEIFNSFDRQTETRFIGALEQADRDAADRIKTLMFTFDDLLKLDRMGAQSLLRKVPRDVVALAIKGAADNVRSFFFGNMSERMGKLIREDIEGLGPVRLRDVDEAQTKMILAAKEMAAKGEIVIAKGGGEEMLI
jgi:flagellar motor switch protein FliG